MKFNRRLKPKRFRGLFSRKADLSLSVNSIVILILAITMLGLGLGFVRFLMGQAQGKIEKIFKQEDLMNPPTRDNTITVSPPDPVIKSGKTEILQVGYYNAEGTAKCAKLKLVNSAGTEFSSTATSGATSYSDVRLKKVPVSSDCRPVEKDNIIGWKVPLTGDNDDPDPVISVLSLRVESFSPGNTGTCSCTGTPGKFSKDLVLTINP